MCPPDPALPPDPEAAGAATPDDLAQDMARLRREVALEGRTIHRHWRPGLERPAFAAGALNLAHYLALRRRDLQPLQRGLMRHGLSSLGRLEGRVLATLDAVGGTLEALAGRAPAAHRAWPPSPRQFFRGEAWLRRNAEELFGPARESRAGRILVTLPSEAAEDVDGLRALVRRGMDMVRINCAHDDPATWARMAASARAAGVAEGREVRVLMDIAGPKIRTGAVRLPADGRRLQPGDTLLLRADPPSEGPAEGFEAQCLPAAILDRMAPGTAVSINDGKITARVEARLPGGAARLRILRTKPGGARLAPEKGLNLPGTDLGLDPLTPKDLQDLDSVAALADMVGHSFVQDAADVARLQAELARRRPEDWRRIGILAKIETLRAVRNLPDILVQAAGRQPFGVMIARGDLAVEIGFARVAEIQEEILWLCEAAHVPVVWATQVLETLVKTGLPTRGEMTDAAMAARAECVMLNKGPHVGEAVEALDGLLCRMAGHQSKKTHHLRALRSWEAIIGTAKPPG